MSSVQFIVSYGGKKSPVLATALLPETDLWTEALYNLWESGS